MSNKYKYMQMFNKNEHGTLQNNDANKKFLIDRGYSYEVIDKSTIAILIKVQDDQFCYVEKYFPDGKPVISVFDSYPDLR